MKVVFFHRKPRPDFNFSVEILFAQIRKAMPSEVAWEIRELRFAVLSGLFLLGGEAVDFALPESFMAWRWKFGDEPLALTSTIGLVLLWVSAILTLYTGWDYFRAGLRHIIDE